MLYQEFMNEIINDCVIIEEDGNVFLAPWYRKIIHDKHYDLNSITDYDGLTMDDVYEHVKLYVKACETWYDKSNKIYNMIYDLITGAKEKIDDENMELIQEFAEFIDKKNSKDRQEEKQEAAKEKFFSKMQFAKKEI